MVRRALTVLLLGAVLLDRQPADAGCVRGEVVVYRYGQPDLVLVPEDRCLVPTDNPQDVVVFEHGTRAGDPPGPPPAGTPTGAEVGLYAPL